MFAYCLFGLIGEVRSDEPLTRIAVFAISFYPCFVRYGSSQSFGVSEKRFYFRPSGRRSP